MEFRELQQFTNSIGYIASDDDLLSLQLELTAHPQKGKIIKKTGGARKIRMGVKGRGKRGGARIVYYWQDQDEVIWMLAAYAKSEKKDLTEIEKQLLATVIADIKGGL